jgi:hypothetical protein
MEEGCYARDSADGDRWCDYWPDFRDDATRGVLVGQVAERMGVPWHRAAWVSIAALVAALEAKP